MKKQPIPEEPKPPAIPTYLVRWKCPECGIFISGFIRQYDFNPRICRGIPRGLPMRDERGMPQPCGAVMNIVHDERRGKV